MKKLLVLALALSVMFTVAGFAQDMSQDSGMAKAAPAPLKNIKGTVKADGDKLSFVSDKDKKSWDVVNPETLKGHEGHHVEVSAHVYADKGQIHVMSVKMLKADEDGQHVEVAVPELNTRGRHRAALFLYTNAAGTRPTECNNYSH